MEKSNHTQKSISKNMIFYLSYQVLNIIFPFLTSMYVARILLPNIVGNVAYAQNIATYFSILAFLGIPTYGIREVAKVRDSKERLSKLYSELFIINLFSTVTFLLLYLITIFFVPEFNAEMDLYMITGGSIALNAINIEWLYSGLEEFTFISTRNIIIKIIAFLCLLLFVKRKEDYLIYALITMLGGVGNNFINMIYSSRFVKLSIRGLNIQKHIKPILILTAVNIAIELYSLIDITMLGFYSKADVAIYSYGSRIYKIFLQIINSFTIVVVPRMACLFKEKNKKLFDTLLLKAAVTIIVTSIPMTIGIQLLANDAIILFYGKAFRDSAKVLRILSLLLIISPLGYLLGSRVLLVAGEEKWMCISVFIAAAVNIVGNCLLIPKNSFVGASVASIFSEIIVFIIYIMHSRKYLTLNRKVLFIECIKISMGSFFMIIVVLLIGTINTYVIVRIICQTILATVVYFIFEFIFNEIIVMEYYEKVRGRIRRGWKFRK